MAHNSELTPEGIHMAGIDCSTFVEKERSLDRQTRTGSFRDSLPQSITAMGRPVIRTAKDRDRYKLERAKAEARGGLFGAGMSALMVPFLIWAAHPFFAAAFAIAIPLSLAYWLWIRKNKIRPLENSN